MDITVVDGVVIFNKPVDEATRKKAEGIKYASRSEALKHLQEDILPEHEKMKRLLTRLEKVENDVAEIRRVKG